MATIDSQISLLLEQARSGDREASERLLALHRDRLERMVRLRMDPRLKSRVDESDVVQEAMIEAHRRLPEYLAGSDMPFFNWLRFLTRQKLVELHRHHIQAQRRSAKVELGPDAMLGADASTASMADAFLADQTSPSQHAQRADVRSRLEDMLAKLEFNDREVLALRLIEQLSNEEAAAELGLQTSAASKRFLRALERLKQVLADFPGGLEG